jgi:subtilase family serine protease
MPAICGFGNIKTGEGSLPQVVTIQNKGVGALVLGNLSFAGESPEAFNKKNDTCTGQTLNQAGNCTVEVVFTPVLTGSYHADLVVPTNDTDEPTVTVDLTGESGADLRGEWLSLSQTCKNLKKGIKCRIKGKLTIRNAGNQTALSSYVRFYLSDNAVIDEGDILLKQVSSGKIKEAKNKNKSFSHSFSYGETASGKYVIAVIDADNTVRETHEGDNFILFGPLPPP